METCWNSGDFVLWGPALGGVPLVYCVTGFVLWTLFVTDSLSFHSVLCSLAEDEVQTESDVVEGMDVALRSKGKNKALHAKTNVVFWEDSLF